MNKKNFKKLVFFYSLSSLSIFGNDRMIKEFFQTEQIRLSYTDAPQIQILKNICGKTVNGKILAPFYAKDTFVLDQVNSILSKLKIGINSFRDNLDKKAGRTRRSLADSISSPLSDSSMRPLRDFLDDSVPTVFYKRLSTKEIPKDSKCNLDFNSPILSIKLAIELSEYPKVDQADIEELKKKLNLENVNWKRSKLKTFTARFVKDSVFCYNKIDEKLAGREKLAKNAINEFNEERFNDYWYNAKHNSCKILSDRFRRKGLIVSFNVPLKAGQTASKKEKLEQASQKLLDSNSSSSNETDPPEIIYFWMDKGSEGAPIVLGLPKPLSKKLLEIASQDKILNSKVFVRTVYSFHYFQKKLKAFYYLSQNLKNYPEYFQKNQFYELNLNTDPFQTVPKGEEKETVPKGGGKETVIEMILNLENFTKDPEAFKKIFLTLNSSGNIILQLNELALKIASEKITPEELKTILSNNFGFKENPIKIGMQKYAIKAMNELKKRKETDLVNEDLAQKLRILQLYESTGNHNLNNLKIVIKQEQL